MSHDKTCHNLYSGCMHLLKLSLMFPLSVACVEHLRNQLDETTLDSQLFTVRLLSISTESSTGFDDNKYKCFVDELKHLNLHMRIKL